MAGVKGRSGGRNAKTAAELKQSGTFRADRHGGIENPEPPVGVPAVPEGLSGLALSEWRRMISRLETSHTLAVVDDGILEQHCKLYAETEAIAQAQIEVGASIDILEDNLSDIEKDQLVQVFQEITKLRGLESKYTTQLQSGRAKLKAFFVEFGLTPAARSRVKVTSAKEDDKTKVSPLAKLQAANRAIRAVK